MKNIRKNGIILASITLLVLFLVLKDDFESIAGLLGNMNPIWIALAIFIEVLQLLFESLAFHQILKSYQENYSFKNTLNLNLISKFFNGITPFSSGGQPMQVYYLNKDGFRITKATNAIMQNFILYQSALITIGLFSLAMNHHYNYFAQSPILKRLVTIGFLINTFVMIFLFVVSFSNRFNQFFIKHGIDIFAKFKIVKDKEKTKKKWLERCDDFNKGAMFIKTHKRLCVQGYFYNILGLISYYLIPFFVAKSLSISVDLLIIPTIVATSYVAIIGAFVPIPGASGGIEFGFLQFFGNFITGSILSATLLIWRAITYYIPMVIGAIVVNIRKDV